MISIKELDYNKDVINEIEKWIFGQNWPVVYIAYNNKYAYVGETLDAVRRTSEHLKETKFKKQNFKKICFITNKTFNKSAILDLESFLISYMSADNNKKITNGNIGIDNHNYFYKEMYNDMFDEIWDELRNRKIVKNSLKDIENSDLFKLSPYKSLNKEQEEQTIEIIKRLSCINNASKASLIQVNGGAGTGKTIMAVYLIKLLSDIINGKQEWKEIDDYSERVYLEKLSKEFTGVRRIGFVVPMKELNSKIKKLFKTINGLDPNMVLLPEEVPLSKRFDVLIVDEGHRLYKRNYLTSANLYNKFDAINEKLMGKENVTKTEDDYTEMDWIIKNSRMQVVFYDELQRIRTTDIDLERFNKICKPHLYKYFELTSQMRCNGGTGYYEYVKGVLFSESKNEIAKKEVKNYDIGIVDNIDSLFEIINGHKNIEGLSKVVAGPAWSLNETIVIENKEYKWATNNKVEAIWSIHKTQGFDLEYTGVIFGKEIYYDEENERIEINKKELKDSRTKSKNDSYEETRNYLLNIYLTLMTRGIKGTYIYVMDEKLREYLKKYF